MACCIIPHEPGGQYISDPELQFAVREFQGRIFPPAQTVVWNRLYNSL